MNKEILIEMIKTDRKLDPDDNIADFASDINDYGLTVPILVDPNLVLVDGLRRLEALKLLGHDYAPAVVAETYEEAISNVKLAHQDRTGVGPRRTWELIVSLEKLQRERTTRLRARYASVPRDKRGTVKKESRTREMFVDALNDTNAAKYGQIYRAAQAGSVVAQGLVRAMEAGEITGSTALSRIESKRGLDGNVTSLSEQRVLLHSATRGLSGLVKGLEKLARPIRLPHDELSIITKELKINSNTLNLFVRLIEKESKRK